MIMADGWTRKSDKGPRIERRTTRMISFYIPNGERVREAEQSSRLKSGGREANMRMSAEEVEGARVGDYTPFISS